MILNINYHKEFVLIPHRFVCTIPLPQTNDDVIVHQAIRSEYIKHHWLREYKHLGQSPVCTYHSKTDGLNLRQYSTPMKRPQQNNKTTQQGYDGT